MSLTADERAYKRLSRWRRQRQRLQDLVDDVMACGLAPSRLEQLHLEAKAFAEALGRMLVPLEEEVS